MERREFLKIAAGMAAGLAAFAASAQAAPLMPQSLNEDAKLPQAQPAVTSREEAEQLQPEEVRWGRGRHRGWGAAIGAGAAAGTGAGAAVVTLAGIAAAVVGAAATGVVATTGEFAGP